MMLSSLDGSFSTANNSSEHVIIGEESPSRAGIDELLGDMLDILYRIVMPMCVLVGVTGNAMVWLLIQSNRNLKKIPSNIYLLALATLSTVFLLTVFALWVEMLSVKALYSGSAIGCKLMIYLAHCSDFGSVWLIVLVCIERFMVLYRFKRTTTVDRAIWHVAILLIAVMAFDSWILVIAKESVDGDDRNRASCDIHNESLAVYTALSQVESVIGLVIPGSIIIVANICCIIKLKHYMKHAPRGSSVSFHPTLHSNESTNLTFTTFPLATNAVATWDGEARKRNNRIRRAELTLTRSLLVVTSVFIVLNLPHYIYRIMVSTTLMDDDTTILIPDWIIDAFKLLSSFMLYVHHAILFYLYIFYSPQMKKRMKPTATKLLECYCLKNVPDFGHYSEGHT